MIDAKDDQSRQDHQQGVGSLKKELGDRFLNRNNIEEAIHEFRAVGPTHRFVCEMG